MDTTINYWEVRARDGRRIQVYLRGLSRAVQVTQLDGGRQVYLEDEHGLRTAYATFRGAYRALGST